MPQTRTEERPGSGYPNKRRPIGSRQRQEVCAKPPAGPDYLYQEVHGTGSGFLIQGAGQQAFAGEVKPRYLNLIVCINTSVSDFIVKSYY